MKKLLSYTLAAAVLLTMMYSCTKKTTAPAGRTSGISTNQVGPASACQIAGVADSNTTTRYLDYYYYNTQGQVDSIRSNSSQAPSTLKTFYRNGNSVVMVTTYNGSNTIDSITVDNNGLLTRDLTTQSSPVALTSFTYTGSQVQQETIQAAAGTSNFSYSWGNGDIGYLITSYAGAPDTTFFTYNTLASTKGDYWWMVNNLDGYGAPYAAVAHQATSVTQGGKTITVAYTYDSDGKITGVTFGGTVAEKVTYQYSCQ